MESDAHGYEIARRLAESGLGDIQGGTLYPILARLSAADHVVSHWVEGERGPSRKYYALTPAGREALREQGTAWRDFVSSTDDLIRPGGTP